MPEYTIEVDTTKTPSVTFEVEDLVESNVESKPSTPSVKPSAQRIDIEQCCCSPPAKGKGGCCKGNKCKTKCCKPSKCCKGGCKSKCCKKKPGPPPSAEPESEPESEAETEPESESDPQKLDPCSSWSFFRRKETLQKESPRKAESSPEVKKERSKSKSPTPKPQPEPPRLDSPSVSSTSGVNISREGGRGCCGGGSKCCKGSNKCCKGGGGKCCKGGSKCCKKKKSCQEVCEKLLLEKVEKKRQEIIKRSQSADEEKKQIKEKGEKTKSETTPSKVRNWCLPMKKKDNDEEKEKEKEKKKKKEKEPPPSRPPSPLPEEKKCDCKVTRSKGCCKSKCKKSKCCGGGGGGGKKCCKGGSKCCKGGGSKCCKGGGSKCCKKSDFKLECEKFLTERLKEILNEAKEKEKNKKENENDEKSEKKPYGWWCTSKQEEKPKSEPESEEETNPEIYITKCDDVNCTEKKRKGSKCCRKTPKPQGPTTTKYTPSGISLKPKPSDTELAGKSPGMGEENGVAETESRGISAPLIRNSATIGAISLGALFYAVYYFLIV